MIKAAFHYTFKGDKGSNEILYDSWQNIHIYCPGVTLARYFNPHLMAKNSDLKI
jgi:hypothetical protein